MKTHVAGTAEAWIGDDPPRQPRIAGDSAAYNSPMRAFQLLSLERSRRDSFLSSPSSVVAIFRAAPLRAEWGAGQRQGKIMDYRRSGGFRT